MKHPCTDLHNKGMIKHEGSMEIELKNDNIRNYLIEIQYFKSILYE